MNFMRKTAILAATLLSVTFASPLLAQTRKAAQPVRSAAWLYKQIAHSAAGEANRANRQHAAETAAIWQSWAAIYAGRASMVPSTLTASGLAAKCIVHLTNVAAAARANNDEAIATLAAAELRMWRSAALQLAKGGAVAVKMPAELLIPVPGLPGTPWAKSLVPQVAAEAPAPIRTVSQESPEPPVIRLEEMRPAQEPAIQKEEPVRLEARIEQRYAILGAVAKPGTYAYEKTTVRFALELAGGLLKTADRGKIAVRRGFLTDPVNSQAVMFDYRKVVDSKAPDMDLLPGDVIEVPTGSPKRGFFDKLIGGAKKLLAPALPF